jgi:hypothetical protein
VCCWGCRTRWRPGSWGGLIAAAAVLIGVVGTEWAIRIRDRRARVDEDATELQLLLPHVVLPISEVLDAAGHRGGGYLSSACTVGQLSIASMAAVREEGGRVPKHPTPKRVLRGR